MQTKQSACGSLKPDRIQAGDEIRVIAPAESLALVNESRTQAALEYLTAKGFIVTFSKHSRELDFMNSSSISSRVADIHQAFLDERVKAVLTCLGGFNVNQILEDIDYSILRRHPKILCGYSDITALLHAVYAKTGLVTYHGPHFSTFGFETEREYTYEQFCACTMTAASYPLVPSVAAGAYVTIQSGACEGTILGGNLCTLNLLQGTEFMPEADDVVLFIEDDNIMGDYFPYEFDRNLQSLLQTSLGRHIRGMIIGRFEDSCRMTEMMIRHIVASKRQLSHIPIVFNADFGHIFPFATFPVGGRCRVKCGNDGVTINIMEH